GQIRNGRDVADGIAAFVQHRRAARAGRPVGRDVQPRGRFHNFAVPQARGQETADDAVAEIAALAHRVAVTYAAVAGKNIGVEGERLQVFRIDADDARVGNGIGGEDFGDGINLSVFVGGDEIAFFEIIRRAGDMVTGGDRAVLRQRVAGAHDKVP